MPYYYIHINKINQLLNNVLLKEGATADANFDVFKNDYKRHSVGIGGYTADSEITEETLRVQVFDRYGLQEYGQDWGKLSDGLLTNLHQVWTHFRHQQNKQAVDLIPPSASTVNPSPTITSSGGSIFEHGDRTFITGAARLNWNPFGDDDYIRGELYICAEIVVDKLHYHSVRASNSLLQALFEHDFVENKGLIYKNQQVLDEGGEKGKDFAQVVAAAESEDQRHQREYQRHKAAYQAYYQEAYDNDLKGKLKEIEEMITSHQLTDNAQAKTARTARQDDGKIPAKCIDTAMATAIYRDLPRVLEGEISLHDSYELLAAIIWCGIPELSEAIKGILIDKDIYKANELNRLIEWHLCCTQNSTVDSICDANQQFTTALTMVKNAAVRQQLEVAQQTLMKNFYETVASDDKFQCSEKPQQINQHIEKYDQSCKNALGKLRSNDGYAALYCGLAVGAAVAAVVAAISAAIIMFVPFSTPVEILTGRAVDLALLAGCGAGVIAGRVMQLSKQAVIAERVIPKVSEKSEDVKLAIKNGFGFFSSSESQDSAVGIDGGLRAEGVNPPYDSNYGSEWEVLSLSG